MFLSKKKKTDVQKNSTSRTGRTKLVFLSLIFALCFGVGLSFHVFEWATQTPVPQLLRYVYEGILLFGYGSLGIVLHELFRSRRTSPARSFWTASISGLLTLFIGAAVSQIGDLFVGDIPLGIPGFDLETGVPLALAYIFKMNVLTLAVSTFVLVLLIKLQDLVLVKRSKSSQRNWYMMLGLMVLASLTVIPNEAGARLTEIQNIALIVVVVFMLMNAFRLSWIVFLSFKEKIATIGLSIVLGIILFFMFSMVGEGAVSGILVPGGYAYLDYYSPPISLFISQSIVFAMLYCTTSFLSLLFHLPTSGEFAQRAGERAAMHSLSQVAGHVFDPEKLYSTITAAPVESGSASSAWLAVADYQTGSLKPVIVATHGIDTEKIESKIDYIALYEDVAQRKEALHLEHAPADHRVSAKPGDGVGSLLVTPLMARDKVLGALFVAKDVVRGFERDDLQTIGIYAAQAAVSMDNAQLFEQQVEKERLARELSIAREVQRRLLPQRTPEMPGLSIAASSVSAHEVGGDYYDFVQLDDHRISIIIGDVSGKGTSAAFYMAEMQGVFQSLSRLSPSPREFLSHANTALAHSLDRNVFISVIYGVLDVEKETFVMARAGHCPAALVDQTGVARYIRTQGMGLGLDRSTLFKTTLEEEDISLNPGDVFALYTDGVVESRSPENEEYGYDRLLNVLSEFRHEDATEIHKAVIRDLDTFLQNREYDDDMTLVIIKWHGIPISESGTLIIPETESTL
ncbi:MAG: GAF domain-containing protein [Bacteroidetes bacterium]|nr:MAG: GAF domain-containing protein [Bacteroidota bacterium]